MIDIDGSYGEGGGQILRTALSLSCLFRKPFRIFNVRKGRERPGLMPQHLAAVHAAKLLSSAEVEGDWAGSTDLRFVPDGVKGGDYCFDIETAGSTLLVLQTLVPALAFSNKTSTVIVKGGTHVPFSPSFHYVEGVFVPFLKRIGITLMVDIESYGFYPKGGGKIRARILPGRKIEPLRIIKRGRLKELKGCSAVGSLPLSIAERQRSALLGKLSAAIDHLGCPVSIDLLNVPTPGQGTFTFLHAASEHSTAGFCALGERGKRAEIVGEEAAEEFIRYQASDSALDPHLADQIVAYLSMCNEPSVFTTSCVTQHLKTNLWTISLFQKFHYTLRGELGKPGEVFINGNDAIMAGAPSP